MKRALTFWSAVVFGILGGLAINALPARAAPSGIVHYRPSSHFDFDLKLNGTPVPLGVITSAGTSKNNHDTAATFNDSGVALKGKVLLLYASAAGRMLPAIASNGTTTDTVGQATTGIPLSAGERVILTMCETCGWVAWKATGDLEVWELQ